MPRKQITRGRIVEASLFSAFKNGMGAVSLADIAQSLQIKKSSLYNHFSGKEEIIAALYDFANDFYSRINFVSEDIFAGTSADNFVDVFAAAAIDYVRQHEVEPLLQVYALAASEKYFSREGLAIFEKQKARVKKQSASFFRYAAAICQNAAGGADNSEMFGSPARTDTSISEESGEVYISPFERSEQVADAPVFLSPEAPELHQSSSVQPTPAPRDASNADQIEFASETFTNAFFSLLDEYLSNKKETIRENPECDAGSLFALPSDEAGLEKISVFVKNFLRKL